ncbi:hypothetical protein AVEN_53438-1 [Araneus ventricosus]|uniref:Uncharacterized protein n=1 Tax=Araneus ventricosus TaxID=182803 RepID=A0A4Y2ABX8_ARAVE|nr:hypothetical protein AVEN_53438-1 [Araneus ventricosus]
MPGWMKFPFASTCLNRLLSFPSRAIFSKPLRHCLRGLISSTRALPLLYVTALSSALDLQPFVLRSLHYNFIDLCTFEEMAPTKFTKFNLRWLDKAAFPQFAGWLSTVKDDIRSAYCTACKSTFSLSNMGIGAIKCHACGSEHKNILKQQPSQSLMNSFFNSQCGTSKSGDSTESANSGETAQPESFSNKKDMEQTIQLVTTNDETLKVGILWAMNVVEKKSSLNSCINISKIFKCMFSDSALALQFQLGKDKVSCIIHYGISHYFHETLLDTLRNCSDITICFDESLNKVAQEGQMDLIERFWMEGNICTRYSGSVFLGRATAQDLLDNFLKALSDIPLLKIQ